MNSYEIYIAIAVMAVVNFFTRVFPFLFFIFAHLECPDIYTPPNNELHYMLTYYPLFCKL